MADGVSWKGAWANDQDYASGDIVRYYGTTYICITAHTSNLSDYLEDDNLPTPVWETLASGLNWTGDWDTSTVYHINDVVKFGGYSYICSTPHLSTSSATGFYTDESNWDILNAGLEYKENGWEDATYYKKNDVVKFGPDVWICIFICNFCSGSWRYSFLAPDFTGDYIWCSCG
jgi:hypothetical protein